MESCEFNGCLLVQTFKKCNQRAMISLDYCQQAKQAYPWLYLTLLVLIEHSLVCYFVGFFPLFCIFLVKKYRIRMDVQSPPMEKLGFVNRLLSLISPELFYLYFSNPCSQTPLFCICCSSSCENVVLFVLFRQPQILFHTKFFFLCTE